MKLSNSPQTPTPHKLKEYLTMHIQQDNFFLKQIKQGVEKGLIFNIFFQTFQGGGGGLLYEYVFSPVLLLTTFSVRIKSIS